MATTKTEITGTLVDLRWPPKCENFFIGAIQLIVDGQPAERVKICGSAEQDELKLHLAYRWYGKWDENERWGRQFKVETFTVAKPHGRTGIVKYLQQAPHIGEMTAIQLWNLFNSDAVRICREHPDLVAAKVPRLKPAQCEEIAEKLQELSALEDTSIDLIELLNGRGFPKATARAVVKKWGNKALRILQADPYKLMAHRGCGFLRCDSMWMDLGLPPAKMKRQYYAIWYSIASDANGHTWHRDHEAKQYLKAKISGAEVDFEKALSVAKRAGILREKYWCNRCRGTGKVFVPDFFTGEREVEITCPGCNGSRGTRWLADARKADAEDFVAEHVAAAALEPVAWPIIEPAKPGERGITEHQASEIAKATQGPIGLLLGSPGTGKTYSAAAIVQALLRTYGSIDVAIAAPTGKAAVRCTESMASYGISLKASTIHSLLGVATAAEDDGGGWSFQHNERNPLPYRFLIIDESSMLSVPLMRSLLAARAKGTHVLFIGDTNQLPPIEHGAPLRDFIAAGVPHGKLTEIKRNAGTIVRACAAIRDKRPVEIDAEIQLSEPCDHCDGKNDADAAICPVCAGTRKNPSFAPKNLKLITASKSQAAAAIEKQVIELRDKGIDPIWNVQVIVAVNKRSPLARQALNQRLQTLLNPNGEGVIGSPFKVGDKVLCLKNSFFKPDTALDSDGKIAIANGEFGRVYKVEQKKTCVEFLNPSRRVVIGRIPSNPKKTGDEDDKDDSAGTGCDLDLGYAVTGHKMQGSDCDYIIGGLDEYPGATGPHGICRSEWLLTLISRARIACYLVGLRSTIKTQCSDTALDKRKTFLVEMIQQYRKSFQGKEKPCSEATPAPAIGVPDLSATLIPPPPATVSF